MLYRHKHHQTINMEMQTHVYDNRNYKIRAGPKENNF
jgi:hypothetical protein